MHTHHRSRVLVVLSQSQKKYYKQSTQLHLLTDNNLFTASLKLCALTKSHSGLRQKCGIKITHTGTIE